MEMPSLISIAVFVFLFVMFFSALAYEREKGKEKNLFSKHSGITKRDLEIVRQKLDYLYSDLQMLQAGSWEPDYASCEASLENVEDIAKLLRIELEEHTEVG